MPRCARIKDSQSIYHVMCKSISEVMLFKEEDDKDYYLGLLSRYKVRYKCSMYAYCLMDNHLHLHFDPKGADISKFMHSINTAYVRYYNKKYSRCGHLFHERFKSKILDTDEYNLAVSAYIHNNPQDIEEYKGKEEQYKYSSYGIYLGIRKDNYKLIETGFIYSLFREIGEKFKTRYFEFVTHHRDMGCLKKSIQIIQDTKENEYRSERKIILRNHSPLKVISYISDKIVKIAPEEKTRKKQKEFRAFCAYVLRMLCGLKYRQICEILFNITLSGCSTMCDRGYTLSIRNNYYKNIMQELMELKVVL